MIKNANSSVHVRNKMPRIHNDVLYLLCFINSPLISLIPNTSLLFPRSRLKPPRNPRDAPS